MSSISSDFTTISPLEKASIINYSPKGAYRKKSSRKVQNEKVEIWVLSSFSRILIKDAYLNNKIFTFSPKYFTIAANSVEKALDKLEDSWGIIVDKSNLASIKVKNLNSVSKEVYVLDLDLTPEQENLLQDHCGGHFYNLFDESPINGSNPSVFESIRSYAKSHS